ncbi:MAG: branched-chain amino acid ABC transporter permease [Dehalococcoidales bacterium]|nr:MAG: branched-chain amino acid ABC transporter permease [Dehalococcoidales bacterium]
MRARGRRKTSYAADIAVIHSGRQWLTLAVFIGLLVVLPLVLNATHNLNWVTFLNFTLIIIIAVLGLNVTTGMTGQVSLGHSAFIMLGGYGLAMLTLKADWPFWAALAVSTLVTGLIALIVAIPAIRLKGFYVAVVTLAFFYIAQYVIRNLDITGGTFGLIGIPSPSIAGMSIKGDVRWYYLLLALTILCVLVSVNITRSRLGRSFLAVRDNDVATAALGVNVPLTKLRAFFVGSLFAALAGGLWASYVSVVRLDQFTIWDSIWYLGMIVIGGAGSTAGAIMGVIFLRLISQILHVIGTSDLIPLSSTVTIYSTQIIYGLVIILFITLKPMGMISIWQKFKINYKRWPFGV